MTEWLVCLLKVVYAFCEAGWRRWFGGADIGYEEKKEKWYNQRGTQHIVGGLVTYFAIFYLRGFTELKFFNWIIPSSWLEYSQHIIAFYLVLVFQFLYWSRAHGPAFDISRDTNPSAETIRRYKKEWWNKFCEWIVPVKDWYTYGYDMMWMQIRYTAMTVLMTPVYGHGILTMGLLVAPIYSFCWALYEKRPELWQKFPKWMQISNATQLAEWINGFSTGMCMMFC